MIWRRIVITFAIMILTLAGTVSSAPVLITRAQADACEGFSAWSRAILAEEERYSQQALATLDVDDLNAIAAATPEQLTTIVEIIDQHLKRLDQIEPPAFALDWQMAIASSGDLSQALFADGALNGIFSVLVDYYDMSVRSDQEIAEARAAATAVCPEFDAFAIQFDLIDGDEDSPAPGFAPWSECTGLDQLGVDIGRAVLQGMVDVPGAVVPLLEMAEDWDVDPSIDWTPFELFRFADYYVAVADHLDTVQAPAYAIPWLEANIAFYRAMADLARGATGVGIIDFSVTNPGGLLAASDALDATIVDAAQSCATFPQFADEN